MFGLILAVCSGIEPTPCMENGDTCEFPLRNVEWSYNKAYTVIERSGWYNVELVGSSILTQFERQVGSTNWKFEERDEVNIAT